MDALQTHLDTVCDSPAFRSAPKVAALLRYLAADTLAGGGPPPTARLIAAAVLQSQDPDSRSAAAAVRMQAGRLRKMLEQYYEGEGAGETVRIELPLRDYRLRFLRGGQSIASGDAPAGDVPILAVAATRLVAPEPALPGVADAFTSNLLATLGGYSLVTTIGPPASPWAAGGAVGGVDPRAQRSDAFMLDAALQAAGDRVRVLAVLTTGLPPRQVWSQAYEFAAAPDAAGSGMAAAARRIAADVADECGAITLETLRAGAAKPVDGLSTVEAIATMWRYFITGSPDDLAFSCQALDHAVAKRPESPVVLLVWAAAACQAYTSSLDPRARLPDLVVERIEAARRAALGHPWIELVRAYVLWLGRHPTGLAAILDQLESVPGSPTFRGMLAAMRIAADLDADRGRRALEAAIAESPQPLLWFRLCAALHDLRHGDLDAADRSLDRIDAPARPEPLVLKAAVAAARGDLDAARRILGVVTDALPEFPVVGEVILRRWIHDDHVDALAAMLQPLGIDWFHRPGIGFVRG